MLNGSNTRKSNEGDVLDDILEGFAVAPVLPPPHEFGEIAWKLVTVGPSHGLQLGLARRPQRLNSLSVSPGGRIHEVQRVIHR